MLEHSRTETGQKQVTDLNSLADEYLKLAYQGWRQSEGSAPGEPAKEKAGSTGTVRASQPIRYRFNIDLKTDFDTTLAPVEVMPQELGRVLLNLYNNAFYAVSQSQKTASADFQPLITLSTAQTNGFVQIRIGDNGIGIPELIKDKIFQSFFTTKPTGEGTGLGLSLAYDIINVSFGAAS